MTELIEQLRFIQQHECTTNAERQAIDKAIGMLSVIHCKDCKHYRFDIVDNCMAWGVHGCRTEKEGYCHKAERVEEDKERNY